MSKYLGLLKQAWDDQLQGGLADKSKPEDFPPKQIEKGVRVELEHTDDKKKAKEIAMDHLKEDKKYYDKLEIIEPHHKKEASMFWEGFVKEAEKKSKGGGAALGGAAFGGLGGAVGGAIDAPKGKKLRGAAGGGAGGLVGTGVGMQAARAFKNPKARLAALLLGGATGGGAGAHAGSRLATS